MKYFVYITLGFIVLLPGAKADSIPSATASVYVTQNGDLFSRIAKKVDCPQNEILALNPLLNPSRLKVGYAMFVPVREASQEVPVWPYEQELVCGPKGSRKIALTFDAGADGKYAGQLLEHLENANVRCSFFITGRWGELFPDAVRVISASGHTIHNHSYSHPDFTQIPDDEIREQVTKAEQILSNLTGQPIKPWFRFPFGARDSRTCKVVADMGYRLAYWTLDSLDSVGASKSVQEIVDRVTTAGGREDPDVYLDGAVVLLHVGNETTVQAIPEILAVLSERGFRVVTMDELLRYDP